MPREKIPGFVMPDDDLTYEPEQLDPELQKELDKVKNREFKSLLEQVVCEISVCRMHSDPKFEENRARLSIYNNQRKDKEAVGDTLLFSVHQTVLASLYNDQLVSTFQPVEQGDEDTTDALNIMMEYDYPKMKMAQINYDWMFDATFFGRGILDMSTFSRKKKMPMPVVINPLTFLHDPSATSINGVNGVGGCSFCGYEFGKTKEEIRKDIASGMEYMNVDKLKTTIYDAKDSLYTEYGYARDLARGNNVPTSPSSKKSDNIKYALIGWYTIWKSKRVFVVIDQPKKNIIRYVELPDSYDNEIPLIDRPIYPISHDWDGVSIPDLIEDKHRARAVITNLGLKIARNEANPSFLFNKNKIKNMAHLQPGFNKYIPVDGDPTGVIAEKPTSGIKSSANFILDLLDIAAQKATATPDIKQGLGMGKTASATEVDKSVLGVDTRYGLSAKIFSWSEQEFCRKYYQSYKEFFAKGIDEKIVRITGALGYEFRKLTADNLSNEYDPDVKVESKFLRDAKNKAEAIGFGNFLNLAILNPGNTNKTYALREFGKLNNIPKQVVEAIIPPTADELVAGDENERLKNNEIVLVNPNDNDEEHMMIHNKLPDDLPGKLGHIKAHIKSMRMKAIEQKKRELENPEIAQNRVQEQSNMQSMITKMTGNANNQQ